MLQIQNIKKTYVTGELVQTALNGVSLNLRENEFVAILGPSGSGKTTLLNVIGGLDRYDSGDLIINGISTKKYTDRDWDSYRNHTIGFVFQSYNLIPHQSVLANVELALTISGITRSERRRRAVKALDDVGLGNQLHKRPNQMSGGQMQRVAIARALVNDPDILLADEPTGALDSETSVQVMELLKQVSRDRLVVMVTHNPDLAESYANRIVRVKDGSIIGDSNPYVVDETSIAPPQHKSMGRASMSFFTALALSFNNLRTKKARTLLTSFAGSIGIIGIALIMSLSTGFQRYIDKIQADTLSNYPLTIQSETADMASAMMAFGSMMTGGGATKENTVAEQQMISQIFGSIGANDMASLKTYLEENYDKVRDAIASVRYSYNIQPRIYADNTENGIVQVNPSTIFSGMMANSMMASRMGSNVFQEMLDNTELLDAQYTVLQGRWPAAADELVMVLASPNRIPDYIAYTLGLKDASVLQKMIAQVMSGKEADGVDEPMEWSYDDLMAMRFRLVSVPDLYRYNTEYGVFEDMSGDQSYMRELIGHGMELKVVGIVCAKDSTSATALTPGIGYTSALTRQVIETAAASDIVVRQLADENINVFTGSGFDEESESSLSFENMISVDKDAISSAFGMNISTESVMNMLQQYLREAAGSLDVDTAPAADAFAETFSALATDMLQNYVAENADESGAARIYLSDAERIVEDYLAGDRAAALIAPLVEAYALPADTFTQVCRPLLSGMLTQYIAAHLEVEELPEQLLPTIAPAAPDEPAALAEEIGEAETAPEAELPTEPAGETPAEPEIPTGPDIPTEPDTEAPTESGGIDAAQLYAQLRADAVDGAVAEYIQSPVVTGAAAAMGARMMEPAFRAQLTSLVAQFGRKLAGYIGSSFYVDAGKLSSAFQFNMTEEELMRLLDAMSGKSQHKSAAANLRALGYADMAAPSEIAVYLVDFAAKEQFIDFLDDYNERMREAGNDEQIIRYTDVTGMMMSSVRTIIDSVSYALIAFVAVSLIVSSIMIGIITYISVMERTKEIGVLRAIGASKHNISQVFNAETFIIGLCSGLIGIGITLLILIPGNQILHHLTDNPDITAQLPVVNALALIALSMLLTLIGGLIPSRQAAKKDPVIALRSE